MSEIATPKQMEGLYQCTFNETVNVRML